eukprot:757836-Hanusia_phi.AAC.4
MIGGGDVVEHFMQLVRPSLVQEEERRLRHKVIDEDQSDDIRQHSCSKGDFRNERGQDGRHSRYRALLTMDITTTPARSVPLHHGQFVVHEYPLIRNMPQVRTIVDPSGNAMAGITRTDLAQRVSVTLEGVSTSSSPAPMF